MHQTRPIVEPSRLERLLSTGSGTRLSGGVGGRVGGVSVAGRLFKSRILAEMEVRVIRIATTEPTKRQFE